MTTDKPATTYREWLLANWQQGVSYREKVERVAKLTNEIVQLEKDIASAEQGGVPEGSGRFLFEPLRDSGPFNLRPFLQAAGDNLVASVFGVDQGQIQIDRWEREALEAEKEKKRRLESYLSMYRDGKSILGRDELWYGSLPALRNTLLRAQKELSECLPTPPFDWLLRWDDKWYEKSEIVLGDMFNCLGWSNVYDFNDGLANFIHDMANKHWFRFAIWVSGAVNATCVVSCQFIPKKKAIGHGWEIWEAVLAATLDFIDAHWEALYAISRESCG